MDFQSFQILICHKNNIKQRDEETKNLKKSMHACIFNNRVRSYGGYFSLWKITLMILLF